MDNKSEAKLRNEIQYLTRLIAAHKAIKSLQTTGETSALKTDKQEGVKQTKTQHRIVVAPSWTYPGSISSHLPLSLANNSASRSPLTSSSITKCISSYGHAYSSLLTRRSLSSSCVFATSNETTSPLGKSAQATTEGSSSLLGATTKEPASTMSHKVGGKRGLDQRRAEERVMVGVKAKKSRVMSSSDDLSRNRYVWPPQQHCSSKNKHKPDQSKLKWQRKPSNSSTQNVLSDGVTTVTKACGTIPISSFVSRKRRRSSSGSGFNGSPFIVRRYQLLRVPSKTPSGFAQRRLHYIKKQSSHSPFLSRSKRRRLSFTASPVSMTTKRKSKNRVWIPEGGGGIKRGETAAGVEVKTKQGNRQWLSAAAVKEKRKLTGTKSRRRGSKEIKRMSRTKSRRKSEEVSIKGNLYLMSKNGKSLKRLSSVKHSKRLSSINLNKSSSLNISSIVDTPSRASAMKRILAYNAVHKSVNRVWCAKRSTNNSLQSQYCLFYNRFGRCNRGKDCPYIHDPKRVAICNKFLRGKCDGTDGSCPFSHNISKEKMPVCSFFLKGVCTRDNCPYLHVSVGPNAELCMDFIKGYCPLGDECKKKHTLTCPDYSKEGSCPRGKHCPLRHWRNPKKQDSETVSRTSAVPAAKKPYPLKRFGVISRKKESLELSSSSPTIITPHQLDFIPLDTNELPEFIAL